MLFSSLFIGIRYFNFVTNYFANLFQATLNTIIITAKTSKSCVKPPKNITPKYDLWSMNNRTNDIPMIIIKLDKRVNPGNLDILIFLFKIRRINIMATMGKK